MSLPNFLIIGAQKSGTTSLKYLLDQHPDVYVHPSELHYFTYLDNENSKHYLKEEDYRACFPESGTYLAIGEKSPSYLYSQEAPKRIKSYNPNMRLFAILRNPIERAYSNYLHVVQRGREPEKEFIKALELEEKRINDGWSFLYHYKAKGLYFEQLSRYYQHFDDSQILIFLLEDFKHDPDDLIIQTCKFLGVDESISLKKNKKHNTSKTPKNKLIRKVFGVFQYDNLFSKTIKKITPYHLRKKMKEILYYKPEIPEDAKQYLLEYYRDDINELQALINRDLSNWLKSD